MIFEKLRGLQNEFDYPGVIANVAENENRPIFVQMAIERFFVFGGA
ncbi:MAG TPA: hypothetical protein VF596_08975 [Pyrinomonadaceae bacterium]